MVRRFLMCCCICCTFLLNPGFSLADLYKYVDKDGTVTYSATPPPADDKKASEPKMVKAKPQMGTSYPSACRSAECFDQEASRARQRYAREKNAAARLEAQSEYEFRRRQQESQMTKAINANAEARSERLKKECDSRRMADCGDDSLRALEEQKIPHYGRYR